MRLMFLFKNRPFCVISHLFKNISALQPAPFYNASKHPYLSYLIMNNKYLHSSSHCCKLYLSQKSLNSPAVAEYHNVLHMGRNCKTCYTLCSCKFHKGLSFNKLLMPCDKVLSARYYKTSSKFTVESPLYLSYLQSLQEDYIALKSDLSSITTSKSEDKSKQECQLRYIFLQSVVGVIEKVEKKQAEIHELLNLINGEEDKELKNMLQNELAKFRTEIAELEKELIDVLVGEEAADNSNIILEVGAGVGGQEAMLFCSEVFNMYCNYALTKGWTVAEVLNDKSEQGGSRKAVAEIKGQWVYKYFKHESGVHRVQRVPKTEKAGRVHTSTISVSVLPQAQEIDFEINSKDLKIETFRNSGPGGQSVNTTDSAVRITHLPTGTVSECRQERSQLRNRELAMKNLRNKIYQGILEEQEQKRRATRKMQMGTRSRSEKIRTFNFQQDRITDHRLKENCSNLSEFMIGSDDLDNLIQSLNELHKIHTLESMVENHAMELSSNKLEKS